MRASFSDWLLCLRQTVAASLLRDFPELRGRREVVSRRGQPLPLHLKSRCGDLFDQNTRGLMSHRIIKTLFGLIALTLVSTIDSSADHESSMVSKSYLQSLSWLPDTTQGVVGANGPFELQRLPSTTDISIMKSMYLGALFSSCTRRTLKSELLLGT